MQLQTLDHKPLHTSTYTRRTAAAAAAQNVNSGDASCGHVPCVSRTAHSSSGLNNTVDSDHTGYSLNVFRQNVRSFLLSVVVFRYRNSAAPAYLARELHTATAYMIQRRRRGFTEQRRTICVQSRTGCPTLQTEQKLAIVVTSVSLHLDCGMTSGRQNTLCIQYLDFNNHVTYLWHFSFRHAKFCFVVVIIIFLVPKGSPIPWARKREIS